MVEKGIIAKLQYGKMLYGDDDDYDDDRDDDDDNDDKDDDEDDDQVVGTPKPEKLLLRVFLVRFRQGGFSWSVIPAVALIMIVASKI